MTHKYDKDPLDIKPEVDNGTDVKETQMLKGKGKFSKAQLADNIVQPYTTGKAPDESGSGMARHPGVKNT
jgi:hypothetical protein